MDNQFQPDGTATFGAKTARPTIGVFRSNYVGYFNEIQWNGILNAAKKLDVNLICYSGGLLTDWNGSEMETAAVIFNLVSAERLDGIVIWTGNINWNTPSDQVERFVKSYAPLPVVSVEGEIDGIPSLVWNDFGGMYDAVTHLIEVHRCKRIAFIRGNEIQVCMEQRYQAYLHALNKHGIQFDPDIVWSYNLFYTGKKSLDLLVDKLTSTDIDAIAVCNDSTAKRLISLMELKGLPILPIVGFDDEIEVRTGKLALTTIRAPFYEIGYRAVEVLLKMIEGKPVKRLESLPCSLVIRHSCGCGSRTIIGEEIWKSKLFNNNDNPDDVADNYPGEFAKRVTGLVKFSNESNPDWAQKLLKVFLEEVQGSGKPLFTRYLEELFNKTVKDGAEADIWQGIILALHFFSVPLIKRSVDDLFKAEELLLKAMMLITELAIHSEIYSHIQGNSKLFDTVKINVRLSQAFDLNTVLDKISHGVFELGISSCYLSIYENSEIPTNEARLILAFDANGPKVIKPEEAIFPASQLVPEGMLSYDRRFDYILKPLYFQKRQIGFVLFEASIPNLSVYEMLSNAISSALNGVIMIGELENQAVELTKANADLESAYKFLQDNQQKLLVAEKMASLGRLTAGIAHEMNTPLAAVRAAIKGLGDLIEEYQSSIGNPQVLPEDHRSIAADMVKYLKLAEQSAEKSVVFIRGIKAQTIDMKFNNSQLFNVAFVISDALSVLDFSIKRGLCTLVTDLDNSIRLYGDPRRLVQVITNLVMNSIEACQPDGGTITVRLANNDSEFAELTVEDTGCGIPEEIISKIFDPMFTTKPFGEGTGLGLSIVHDLVNEYQGNIKVNSQKGLTAFRIMLPLKKEESING